MINLDTHAPTAYPGTLTFDTALEPTLRGIIVKEPGTLSFKDITGQTVTLEFAATDPSATGPSPGCDFPFCLKFQIREILSANTTLTASQLVGLV